MSQLNEGCTRIENNLLQADCLPNFGVNKEEEKRREEKRREEKRREEKRREEKRREEKFIKRGRAR